MRIQHTEDCDDLMVGRAVRDIIADDDDGRDIEQDAITCRVEFLRLYEPEGRCDCAKLALIRTTEQLRVARKTQRAIAAKSMPSSATYNLLQERIDALVSVRDELRAQLAELADAR